MYQCKLKVILSPTINPAKFWNWKAVEVTWLVPRLVCKQYLTSNPIFAQLPTDISYYWSNMLIPLLRILRNYPRRFQLSRDFGRIRTVALASADWDSKSSGAEKLLTKNTRFLEENLCFKIKRRQLFSTKSG